MSTQPKQPSVKVTAVKAPNARIIPCGDRLIVTAPPAEQVAKDEIVGGIVIPASVSNATKAGVGNIHSIHEIVAAGPDCPDAFKPARKIVLLTRDIFPFKVDGVEHYFTRAASVVAILG